jgi:YVTN family beta-propeller protein
VRAFLTGKVVIDGGSDRLVTSERLPGRQGRLLFAFLLIEHDRLVPKEELAELLWGDRPPATWDKALGVLVSRLRTVLSECGLDGSRILTSAFGCYQLNLPEDTWLDVDAAAALADSAEAALAVGRFADAATDARAAAELARRPLLPGEEGPWVDERRADLTGILVRALDCLAAAALDMGDSATAVEAATQSVALSPYRETGHQHLMRAHAAAGNRAEALRAFERCRTLLADELGVDPDPQTEAVYLDILRAPAAPPPSDTAVRPARSTPTPSTPAPSAPAPSAPQRSRRRRRLVLAATATIVLAGTAATVVLWPDNETAVSRPVPANSLAAIDPSTNRVVRTLGVGAGPGDIVSAYGSLWVANLDDGTVSQVDPATAELRRTVVVGSRLSHLASNGDTIWYSTTEGEVGRIDGQFGAVTKLTNRARAWLINGPRPLSVHLGSVWVVDPRGLVDRLDPDDGRVQASQTTGINSDGIAVDDDAAWVANAWDGTVTRVDRTNAVAATIPVGHGPRGVATSPGAVWVANRVDNVVVRIDTRSDAVVATIRVGLGPSALAVGGGALWVANTRSGSVSKIDLTRNRVVKTIDVGASPSGLAFVDDRLWLTTSRLAAAVRTGGVLHLESSLGPASTDPALTDNTSLAIHYATCAKLLNYPDERAPLGFQLTPEVAESVPVPSADGRSYRFVIRPGFRFAPPSNEPVTAQTFRHSIERLLDPMMQSPIAYFAQDIDGAAEYTAGKASHVRGLSVDGNILMIRLTAPAPNFLSRLANPVFCAVPTGTPADPKGVTGLPSAGPYTVASYVPDQQLVLERNPNYRGSRPHHFRQIVLTIGVGPAAALRHLKAGTADYVPDTLPISAYAALDAEYGPHSPAAAAGHQRYFVNPASGIRYFALNSSRPLFADAKLRRAVNYAVDRPALAEQEVRFSTSGRLGGAVPTAGYLPPGFPGYSSTSVYPLDGPDVARARALARGRHGVAELYTCDQSPCREQAEILKRNLAAIGIDVVVRQFPKPVMFSKLLTPGEPYDITTFGWFADYPDPQDFLEPLFDGTAVGQESSFNIGRFDVPMYNRKLHAAAQLSGPSRYLTYGRLANELLRDAAPAVAYAAHLARDFFSARIGCQLYQPVYGIDLANLCLRS